MITRYLKRISDVFLAAATLVLLSPLLGIVAVAIYFNMGRPVLIRHVRPGQKAIPFELLKFRTMTEARDLAGTLRPDEQRLTKLGIVLRRLSVDELPQLWNVLKGEMSLVGPRPLLMQYLERYSLEQARRHEVKPGITGWAQVNGRNDISWEQRFQLDVWYVDHWSLALDARILAMTFRKVFLREGIVQNGYATMPEFMGKGRIKG